MAAFREVAPDGVLPPAPKTRRKLVDAGLVSTPERDVADGMQKRIVWLERAVPQIKPHAKLAPLLDGYSARLRDVAARLDEIAETARPPIVPPGEPCLRHGARCDAAGTCKDCRRRDVRRSVRIGNAA